MAFRYRNNLQPRLQNSGWLQLFKVGADQGGSGLCLYVLRAKESEHA